MPGVGPGPLHSLGPILFQLAFFAIGGDAEAEELASLVLADDPDAKTALRRLASGLPNTTSGWPMAEPARAPGLAVTHEVSVGLLAMLGRMAPIERLALGAHLLLDLPPHELGYWLAAHCSGERVADCLLEIGAALDLIPPVLDEVGCRAIGPRIVDIDDADRGRIARLHLLGCDRCAPRAEGVRRTRHLLREAIEVFFPRRSRVLAPSAGRSAGWRRQRRLEIAGTCAAALLAAALMVWQPSAGGRPTIEERMTAASLIDHALHRLDLGIRRGVLHERYQAGSGEESVLGERWIEYQAPQRMRLVLTRLSDRMPMLDLASDGRTRLQYSAQIEPAITMTEQLSDPRVADLISLLRQLPATGAMASFPPTDTPADLTLIAAARRANAALLGTTMALGRFAYLLTYTEPGAERRIVLTIDAVTSSLLKATATSGKPNAPPELLWQAETVEVLPEAPPQLLDLRDTGVGQSLPDPRHLLLNPFSNVSLSEVARKNPRFPVPSSLPPGTSLAFLHDADFFGTIQAYEGDWTSVVIATPLIDFTSRPKPPLEHRTGEAIWRVVHADSARGITQIAFAPASEPSRRSLLYVWHAFQRDDERQATAGRILGEMRWLKGEQITALEGRFVAPPGQIGGATSSGR